MYHEGIGRRKTSTARVRLHEGGSGQILVNGKAYSEYFGREADWRNIVQPFQVTQTAGQFDVTVQVNGGGITGQSEAIGMGVARALLKVNSEFRSVLRSGGFLTRDDRMKERKKAGLKRARKAPQYTKR
ncbi:MAG: 30S ribosomal protein S9 [Anaerolineae bacterium]|nr:30S ribosomal protein S9 [Anaerolineae bacterium]